MATKNSDLLPNRKDYDTEIQWSRIRSVQGSLIGILLFIIELSDAGMPVPAQPDVSDVISVSSPSPAVTEDEIRLKYVDDQTQGTVVYLKTDLDLLSEQAGPRLYHDRHGHVLPPDRSVLQTRLNDIQEYATVHKLKINEGKTKIMSFNFSNKFDFLPKLTIGDKELEVVSSTKLLGVILSFDLK